MEFLAILTMHEQSLHSFLGKPCEELQISAIPWECRTHVVPQLRVTALTDRTVKRIQEKLTAELRFAARKDKES